MSKVQTIEDVPLLKTSLRIMKFWSFLIVHNWRRYTCLIPYFMINTTQFLDIYFSTESIDAIIRNAYITVLFFNTILRAVMLCINRHKYEQFMENLRILYLQLKLCKDMYVMQMLNETVNNAHTLAKINLLMGTLSCIGFVIYPLFATTKGLFATPKHNFMLQLICFLCIVLPFGMYVPGIDKYESPYYELFFIIQVIMTPMGCCMYIPFTNLIVAFIMFAILMCKVLQYKLQHLSGLPEGKTRVELIWCIKYQLKVISYVDYINHLTTYIFLIEFLAFGAILCALLFLLIIVETIGQMVIVSAYIVMIFSQSVVMYYYANELYFQSLNVAIAAYESNWFDFDVSTQKILKLLILRAQKPCAILVGNVYPMNLAMLQSLLNATYSYFTLLKRIYG